MNVINKVINHLGNGIINFRNEKFISFKYKSLTTYLFCTS